MTMARRFIHPLLSFAVLLGACMAMAAPAHAALSWTPNRTTVSASATGATLRVGTTTITCASDLTGVTGTNDNNLSMTATFSRCTGPDGTATVACTGTITLVAMSSRLPGDGDFLVTTDSSFTCSLVYTLSRGRARCSYTIRGLQRPTQISRLASNVLTFGDLTIIASQDLPTTATCGPSGNQNVRWGGTYIVTTPASLTITP